MTKIISHPKIKESKTIALFLKNFLFKIIWTAEVDISRHATFRHSYELLLVFYDRDTRTEFVGADNWLVKTVKPSVIVHEYQRDKFR